ncbi:LysR family transcriptional regulator [Paraburkholderia agricolaris]|uniref:LysR family transcriptional regulator n=1 Tax=Paraburkholderia agricolaris TaxID=2152888 RepID=UPI0038BA7DC0
MDRILSLRAYVATLKCGSFSAAARELNVVPSVLTRRIQELEGEIGEPLFIRTTRSVAPTTLASIHADRATRLLTELDLLLRGTASTMDQHTIQGKLKIKVPTALATFRLRPAFLKFQRSYPNVELDIALIDRHISPVEDGYDLAIGVVQLHPGGVMEEVLCPLRHVLCAAPHYLRAREQLSHPRQLANHDCLTFFPAQAKWEFEKNGAQVSVVHRPKYTCNDLRALLSAALAGNGLVLLPDYVVQAALDAGTLERVLSDWEAPPLEIRAVIPRHRVGDVALLALLDVLKETLNHDSI